MNKTETTRMKKKKKEIYVNNENKIKNIKKIEWSCWQINKTEWSCWQINRTMKQNNRINK